MTGTWRRPSVGGGEEEDDGGDPGLPSSIPSTRRTRTARPSKWRLQLVPGRLQSTAMWRRAQLGHGHGGAAARVAARGEKEGEEEQQVAGVVFILQGGPGGEEAAEEAPRRRRSWRQCYHCRHRKTILTGGSPCQVLPHFLFPFYLQQLLGIYLGPQTIF